jgi:hypothetical protein
MQQSYTKWTFVCSNLWMMSFLSDVYDTKKKNERKRRQSDVWSNVNQGASRPFRIQSKANAKTAQQSTHVRSRASSIYQSYSYMQNRRKPYMLTTFKLPLTWPVPESFQFYPKAIPDGFVAQFRDAYCPQRYVRASVCIFMRRAPTVESKSNKYIHVVKRSQYYTFFSSAPQKGSFLLPSRLKGSDCMAVLTICALFFWREHWSQQQS